MSVSYFYRRFPWRNNNKSTSLYRYWRIILNSTLEEIKQHQNTAIDLWMLREDYISLLTDFPTLTTKAIASKRDDLQKKAYEIYKSSPLTDKESYCEAQKALKSEEEQFFTPEEIDKILPSHLRVKIGGDK